VRSQFVLPARYVLRHAPRQFSIVSLGVKRNLAHARRLPASHPRRLHDERDLALGRAIAIEIIRALDDDVDARALFPNLPEPRTSETQRHRDAMTMMTVRFTFKARRGERRRDGTKVERGVERTNDAFVEGARGRGGRARRVKFCRSVSPRGVDS
jgi:hypothetical protein